ncbi:MAG: RtcB family protein [Candidatus Thermoplasmatota archaeon]|nr:RtcB family protein [Candidatus Thermoplasmatota archaeon]
MVWSGPLKKLDNYRYEIPQNYKPGMRTSGVIYATEKMIDSIRKDDAPEQVANVAMLPGIVGKSLAMPDIHLGYGFAIGGVAATSYEEGVISPGGVGFDINCGVRLLKTNLILKEVHPKIKELIDRIFVEVPSGVGSRGKLRLSTQELESVLEQGAEWAVEKGYGWQEDLEFLEERGEMKDADSTKVSHEAKSRGAPQLGTLGAGNHFLEIEKVDEIYDEAIAKVFGIERKDQILVLLHTGSRGCGHQICTDHLREMERAVKKYNISLPDRQLACAPSQSPEAQNYFKAMCCAANYAWANRQMIVHWTRESFEEVFGESAEKLEMHIIYDVAHNIAKLEEHEYEGRRRKLYVHRKGATRAFPKWQKDLPNKYKSTGQPVLIPGDMGTASYVLVGTELGMKETFGSTCHGSGRVMSRNEAIRKFRVDFVKNLMEQRNIYTRAASRDVLCEEAPDAYKRVDDVVEAVHGAGISLKVARLKPIGVMKG